LIALCRADDGGLTPPKTLSYRSEVRAKSAQSGSVLQYNSRPPSHISERGKTERERRSPGATQATGRSHRVL